MSNKAEIGKAENIMNQIRQGQIKMKPRWYFMLGALFVFCGLFGLFVISVFLVSLVAFSLRTHGPMGQFHFEQLISSFPWWSLGVILFGFGIGAKLLRKYDFAYRKNFVLIILITVLAIIFSGWFIDYFGLDNIWMKRGMMRGMYQRYDGGVMPGCGRKMMQDINNEQSFPCGQ